MTTASAEDIAWRQPAKGCGCRHAWDLNDYMRFVAYSEEAHRRGERQLLCVICCLWRWPAELGPKAKTITEREHKRQLKSAEKEFAKYTKAQERRYCEDVAKARREGKLI